MTAFSPRVLSLAWGVWLISSALTSTSIAQAQVDPLSLQSAPVEQVEAKRNIKLFVEGAIGTSSRRYGLGSQEIGRASFDLVYSAKVGQGLSVVLSNRVDYLDPVDAGADSTVNSLREAYVTWQSDSANSIYDFGRMNLRYGPAYGYNPTDFFRDGSLRTLTTANPFALRENRLGTFVLRGQRLWNSGSLAISYSPKLSTRPSADGWSLDFGATNNRDRGVIVLGTQLSEGVSTQLLLYKEAGLSPKLGASLTALLSDAAVLHAEWSRGSEPDLLSRALLISAPNATRNRVAAGVTYTTLGKLSITAEYQYNGFALGKGNSVVLGLNPIMQEAYFTYAQRVQDLATRQAFLLYVTQKDIVAKNLDLTAFLRVNSIDHSKLAWFELRRHWSNFDLAIQYQQNIGRVTSEYGILPERRVIQVLGTYYF